MSAPRIGQVCTVARYLAPPQARKKVWPRKAGAQGVNCSDVTVTKPPHRPLAKVFLYFRLGQIQREGCQVCFTSVCFSFPKTTLVKSKSLSLPDGKLKQGLQPAPARLAQDTGVPEAENTNSLPLPLADTGR